MLVRMVTVHQNWEQWPPGGIRFGLVGTGVATGGTGATILDLTPRASVEIASPSIIGLVTEIISKLLLLLLNNLKKWHKLQILNK